MLSELPYLSDQASSAVKEIIGDKSKASSLKIIDIAVWLDNLSLEFLEKVYKMSF